MFSWFKGRRIRIIAVPILAGMVILSAGCYGKFPLTRAVYRFNGSVTEYKIVHTLLFWVFVILPVYWIAMLGDAIIFNLVEFWTGSTLEVSESRVTEDGTAVTLKSEKGGHELVLTMQRPGEAPTIVRYIHAEPGWTEARNAEGALMGFVHAPGDGMLEVYNADRQLIQVVGAKELKQDLLAMAR